MPDTIIEGLFLAFFALGAFFTVAFTVMLIAEDWR